MSDYTANIAKAPLHAVAALAAIKACYHALDGPNYTDDPNWLPKEACEVCDVIAVLLRLVEDLGGDIEAVARCRVHGAWNEPEWVVTDRHTDCRVAAFHDEYDTAVWLATQKSDRYTGDQVETTSMKRDMSWVPPKAKWPSPTWGI